ncbi:hypothetical protein C5167_048179 [Papaver somniferum]|uniref:Uncharacterized protein n=1 Tax=Papaver somniferum TaxID=3469 RepID=A0A4Y7KH70_PAPSO|nr:hypothetical protein C5167_048179 [Papaver somniferum]
MALIVAASEVRFVGRSSWDQSKGIDSVKDGISLIPITLAGLFVTAYLQYKRGDQLDL